MSWCNRVTGLKKSVFVVAGLNRVMFTRNFSNSPKYNEEEVTRLMKTSKHFYKVSGALNSIDSVENLKSVEKGCIVI